MLYMSVLYAFSFVFPVRSFEKAFELTSEHYEKQLARTVIEYRKTTDSGISGEKEDPDGDYEISYEVLASFGDSLRAILERLSNFYHSKLPNTEDVLNAVAGGSEVREEISLLQSSFEAAVCSFVPRSMDFVSICLNDFLPLFDSYRLHFDICYLRPFMIARACESKTPGETTYVCDARNVLDLLAVVRKFPDERGPRDRGGAPDERFVMDAFRAVNGVDKVRVMSALRTNVRKVVFESTDKNYFVSRWLDFRRKPGKTREDKGAGELAKTLGRLNGEYASRAGEDVAGLPVPHAVYRLVTRALVALETDFKFNVYNLYNNVMAAKTSKRGGGSIGKNDVVRELNGALGDLCEHTPLVLLYLSDSCSPGHLHKTEIPMGLYLTLCGSWAGFLKTHCPWNGDDLYERSCVVHTILDRLSKNYYSITGNVSGYDDALPDDRGTRAASDYVKYAHDAVGKYYGDRDDTPPVWTSSDWLTGRRFLFDAGDSGEMGELRFSTIRLFGAADAQPVDVTLEDAHDVLLPWYSDAHNVFAFHELLKNHMDGIMNDFVYRHAKTVVMYFEHVEFSVCYATLKRISNSLKWYTRGAERFREYLSLPGPYKPPDEPVRNVVSAIRSLDRVEKIILEDERDVILRNFSVEKQKELSKWADGELANVGGRPKMSYADRLSRIANANCASAAAFLDRFFAIANKSLGVVTEEINVYELYCLPTATDLFGA